MHKHRYRALMRSHHQNLVRKDTITWNRISPLSYLSFSPSSCRRIGSLEFNSTTFSHSKTRRPHRTWTRPNFYYRRKSDGYSRRLSCLGRTQSTQLESKGKTRLWRTGRSCCWRRPCSVHCRKWGGLWLAKVLQQWIQVLNLWLTSEIEISQYSFLLVSAHGNKNGGIRPRRHRMERETPRDILSYCLLPHWSIASDVCLSHRPPYIHLFFHSVTSHSNDSKLPYTRKNHRRTTCSPNTQVLTSSTSHSSNRIDREFARVYLGSPEFRGAAALTAVYHALLRIPTRAETSDMSPRKYCVASKIN